MDEVHNCCLCGKQFVGFGNGPYPLCDEDDYESRCCDQCNSVKVIPARLALLGGADLAEVQKRYGRKSR